MKKAVIVLVIVFIFSASVLGWLYFRQAGFRTVRADRGNVTEVVSETGELVSRQDFNLKFKVSGNVKSVSVKTGDTVKSGQTLVSLDDSEIKIQLDEARSALSAARASLKKVREGARQEDIRVYRTAAENAETTLANAQKELEDIKKSGTEEIALAQTELENAEVELENVSNQAEVDLGSVYDSVVTALPKAAKAGKNALLTLTDIQYTYFTGYDQDSLRVAEAKKEAVLPLLGAADGGRWTRDSIVTAKGGAFGKAEEAVADPSSESIDQAVILVLDALQSVKKALEAVPVTSKLSVAERADLETAKDAAIMETIALSNKQQAVKTQKQVNRNLLDKAENAVALARQKLSSVRAVTAANITLAENAVRSARGNLKSARDQLALKKADPLKSDISFYQARVSQARSRVDLLTEQLNNLVLKSPANGVITAREVEEGEFISAGEIAVSMIAEKGWRVEAYIAEEDILKVKTGDRADVTLDAYGKRVFSGNVFSSEPQRTVIDDSVYYKTILILDEEDDRFRNGMTADVSIITDARNDVLRVDRRALRERDGGFIVYVKKGWKVTEREVGVGLIGRDYAEITSGLDGGEEVIIAKK